MKTGAGNLFGSRLIGWFSFLVAMIAHNDFFSWTTSTSVLLVKSSLVFASVDSMLFIWPSVSVFSAVKAWRDAFVWLSTFAIVFSLLAWMTAITSLTNLWTFLFASSPCWINRAYSSSSWPTVFIFACKLRFCSSVSDLTSIFCLSASSSRCSKVWPAWSIKTQVWQTAASQFWQKYFSSSFSCRCFVQKDGRFNTSSKSFSWKSLSARTRWSLLFRMMLCPITHSWQ